jgi:hypothetical protein
LKMHWSERSCCWNHLPSSKKREAMIGLSTMVVKGVYDPSRRQNTEVSV